MNPYGVYFLLFIFGLLTSICMFEQGPSNAWHRQYLAQNSEKYRSVLLQGLLMFTSWVGVFLQLICWALAWLAPPMNSWKQARHNRLHPPMPAHDEVRAEDFPFRR